MNADGLPEWIPPWWIDQQQRPQINTRIQRIHAQRGNLRHRRQRAPDGRMEARVLSLRRSTVGFDNKRDEQFETTLPVLAIRWQLPTAGRLAAPFDRPRISRAPTHTV
jgi:hypothetical protein